MKTTILGFGVFVFSAASMAVQAETLTYQGLAFTNAAMSIPVEGITSTPFSVGESIDLSMSINAPLGDNLAGAIITPSALTISGPSQMNFLPPQGTAFSDTFAFSTDSKGNITGWSFAISDGPQLSTNTSAIFTVTSSNSGGNGGDTALANYFSPAYANPNEPSGCCFSSADVATPGSWIVARAPEMNPASAVGSLTLLFGGLAVLRGRRRLRIVEV